MHPDQLQTALRRLHDELSHIEGVDPETLDRLRTITEEMQRALDERDNASSDVESTATGLKDLLLQFEAEHPRLSVSVGRVADALAAMGF